MRGREDYLQRRLVAEALGSFFLFAGVVGSGIMGEALSGGNIAVALLANSVATGAILAVLIAMLGPISGAHFNPAVTLAFLIRREIAPLEAAAFVLMQIGGGILGVWAAHFMFDLPVWQLSEKVRTGSGQWLGEGIATFGLVLTILGTIRVAKAWVPASVALYITAAYWFTSSTSFANPAITIGRSLTNSFAGIAPADVVGFVLAQFAGAIAATVLSSWLFRGEVRSGEE
ncbi:MIP/aquaporin family protein [Qipengyuania vesicularis]|uniref:aquaporin n=1 Tax=Qipengyuania vesicularis TaxID=2867232 RepID=UPI001C8889E4|nr:aquaporin family protein [Qipengyuania vesicularis]